MLGSGIHFKKKKKVAVDSEAMASLRATMKVDTEWCTCPHVRKPRWIRRQADKSRIVTFHSGIDEFHKEGSDKESWGLREGAVI